MGWDLELDCAGLLCPLPVLRARKRLIGMRPGQVLRVLATDAMAAIDLPHFCAEAGHEFLGQSDVGTEGPGDAGGQPTGAGQPALARQSAYLIRRGKD